MLTERMKRKDPSRAAPKLFDAGEITLVTACFQGIEGDREAKLRANRKAIEGA